MVSRQATRPRGFYVYEGDPVWAQGVQVVAQFVALGLSTLAFTWLPANAFVELALAGVGAAIAFKLSPFLLLWPRGIELDRDNGSGMRH